MRVGGIVLSFLLLSGCVTEETIPGASDVSKDDVQGPLERAQASVRRNLKRLPNLYGQHLLRAMQAIISYEDLAVDPILEVMDDADERTLSNLIYILGFVGGDKAHAAVLPHLASENQGVRFEAAAALVNLGDYSGIPVLLAFMASKDRRLRFKASEVIKEVVKDDMGYLFDAPPPEREKALARLHRWWEQRREALIYGPAAAAGEKSAAATDDN